MEKLFNKLNNDYQLEWNDSGHNSFFLYFKSLKGKDYRIFIDDDVVEIGKYSKFWHIYIIKRHEHPQSKNKDELLEEIYTLIKKYINCYSNK